MAIQNMNFTPANGLRDATYSPTNPTNETTIRNQIQGISDQIKDFVNDEIIDFLNETFDPLTPTVSGQAVAAFNSTKDNSKQVFDSFKRVDQYLGVTSHVYDPSLIAKLADYEFKYVRVPIDWSLIETTAGVYDFSAYDSKINNIIANGMTPMLLLDGGNSLYGINNTTNRSVVSPSQITAFTNYASAIADHYKNKSILWEIWNEPNNDTFWTPQVKSSPADYANLVKAVYPVIKQKDPTGKVVGGVIGYNGFEGILTWFRKSCESGLLGYLDMVSIHVYMPQNPESYLGYTYDKIKGIINRYSDRTIPIVCDELGYSTVPNWDGTGSRSVVDEATRAKYLVRELMIGLMHGIDITMIYEAVAPQTTTTNVEHWFGIFDPSFNPKSSATAIKNIMAQLSGYSYLNRVITPERDYVLKFVNTNNNFCYVAWTTDTNHSITIEGTTIALTDAPQFVAATGKLSILDLFRDVQYKRDKMEPGVAFADGGETFNSPTNVVSGDYAHAEGDRTFAGLLSHAEGVSTVAFPGTLYTITSSNAVNNTITVSSVSGLSVGDKLVVKSDFQASVLAKITAINGLVISLDADIQAYTWTKAIKYIDDNIYAAHAEGANNVSSGSGSHAEGQNNVASGNYSHAEGVNNTATGLSTHAEGQQNTAPGMYSHVQGYNNVAYMEAAHVEGERNVAGQLSHAEGVDNLAFPGILYTITNVDTANNKITLDTVASLSVNDEIAIKKDWDKPVIATVTSISGLDITTNVSVNTGWKYVVKYTTDYYGAHAEGVNTLASGTCSHVEGQGCIASGMNSHAGGYNTHANVRNAVVIGQFNKSLAGTPLGYSASNDAFVIGNGANSGSKGNAFRVTAGGAVYGLSAFNSTGADYAEFFEWADKNENQEDRVGYFVTLEGDKIRKATAEDSYVLGIVSVNPSIIGDSWQDDWCNKFVTDEWGRIQYHTVHVNAVQDEDGNTVIPAHTDMVPVINPNWDTTKEYIPRERRPEWSPIGMMGKLLVRDDGTCKVNGFCKPDMNGIATDSQGGYRVMKRVSESIIQVLLK